MSLPQLYYDPSCPVCRSFAKLLQKNLPHSLQLCPMSPSESSQATEFRLVLPEGTPYHGIEAIQELERQIPAIRDFFWMLPDRYRGKALVQTYRLGRWFRKLWGCRHCP